MNNDAMIIRQIQAIRAAADMTVEDTANMFGMSKSTMCRRMKHPGEFTLSEIRGLDKLAKKYGITVDWVDG